jgi:hypothetical protein
MSTFDPVPFPVELQPYVDILVDAALRGDREPEGPAFDLVTSWCEVHPDEASAANGDSFGMVWWRQEVGQWTDDAMADHLSGDGGTVLDDGARTTFLRKRLIAILEGDETDADIHPAGCELVLQDGQGRRASLCYLLSGYSFTTGPLYEWVGLFTSFHDFRAAIESDGGLTRSSQVAELPDAELLACLRRTN